MRKSDYDEATEIFRNINIVQESIRHWTKEIASIKRGLALEPGLRAILGTVLEDDVFINERIQSIYDLIKRHEEEIKRLEGKLEAL